METITGVVAVGVLAFVLSAVMTLSLVLLGGVVALSHLVSLLVHDLRWPSMATPIRRSAAT